MTIKIMKKKISKKKKEDNNIKKKEIMEKCKSLFGMKFKEEIKEEKEKESIWTKEEMFLLQKGVKKYPAGTKKRWDKIKEIVKTKKNQLEMKQLKRQLKKK